MSYKISIDYKKKIDAGESPFTYVIIKTKIGAYVYGKGIPNLQFYFGLYLADGTWTADGSVIAGDEIFVDIQSRILSFGDVSKIIQPQKYNLLLSMTKKEQQNEIITLDDRNYSISKKITIDPWLTQSAILYNGFLTLPRSEHRKIFNGAIDKIERYEGKVFLTIIET